MTADRLVGRSVPRVDGRDKVTGAARFCGDLSFPGMLYARILRSPVVHGRIESVDSEAARRLPGVKLVLTGADLGAIDPYFGPAFKDRPILAIEKVRYEGEPVAAVVAEDRETAARALELIDVAYQELPAVTSVEQAVAPGAPLVHSWVEPAGHFRDLPRTQFVPERNICHRFELSRGRGEAGLEDADVVMEGTYRFPMAHHYAMEPHTVIAACEGNDITIWSTTQNPYSVRSELAKIFDVPMGAIRIVVPYLGGGFGAKTYAKLEPIAVVLARAARRPVLVETTVDEGFRTVRRCNAVCRVRIGANRDGRLVALATEIHYDVGAYADITPRVVQKGSYTAAGPYRIPHAHIQAYAVYTNTTPGGAFRGFGVPQISWAVESQLSEVAHHLGIDPIQLRMQNLLSKGDEYAAGDLPIDGDYRAGLGKLVEAMGTPAPQGEARGRGIACVIKASIAPSLSQALVRLHVDGSLTVLTSTVEMGQGARTALAQIAAEALGVPMESVRVALPDTAVTPYDQTTSSSRSTTIMGRVVQDAIRDLRRQLLPIAARLLQEPEEDLRLESGRVVGRTGSSVGLGAIVEAHFGMRGGELIGSGTMRAGFAPDAPLGGATPFWEVGMGAADVGVDRETGVLSVHRYVSLADVGCAINPQQTEAQEEGAVMQGLGHTLFERMVYEGGQLLNGSLVDYRVPRFTDVPCELHSILIENADGAGPFGAKGVGESGLLPVAPAVADALWAATGVRMRELPLEPEAVWRALRAHAEGAATPSRNAPVAARPPVVA